MTTLKPDELHRKHLTSRNTKALIDAGKKIGHLTEQQKKSPSQKRSENIRKKLNRGIEPVATIGEDCNSCSKYPCGNTIQTCDEPSRKNRCAKCGQVIVYRFVAEGEWKYCDVCRGGFR